MIGLGSRENMTGLPAMLTVILAKGKKLQNFELSKALNIFFESFTFSLAKNLVCVYFIYSGLSPQRRKANTCLC